MASTPDAPLSFLLYALRASMDLHDSLMISFNFDKASSMGLKPLHACGSSRKLAQV